MERTHTKLNFASDYNLGACPEILSRLMEKNSEHQTGYGLDEYCKSAAEKIREACKCPEAVVSFLEGGTQTNATVIDALIRNYQGAVAVGSGHINGHESGAVEAAGHKILTLPGKDGKMQADELEIFLKEFHADANREHMVEPGVVYISHPTECGTLYSKQELTGLHEICGRYHIPLYLDGARLGYGLAARDTDVTLEDIAANVDAFYIGGTKVGALFGEAVVFTRKELASHFFTITKQHGALLAKGWILGLQFDTLFSNHLYEKLGENGIRTAMKIKETLADRGYRFAFPSNTNQQFVILSNEEIRELEEKLVFTLWDKWDEAHSVIRLATSFGTTDKEVEALLSMFEGRKDE